MKTLDKYVAKSFVTGYLIAFMVLIGLCIVVDLFVNIDEFAEHSDKGIAGILGNVIFYYGSQSTLYFRDLAGMITVLAAVFSLGKMTRNNELIAVMASGVSLKRIIAPIIVLSLLFTGLLVIDQEVIIPSLTNNLVRSQDYDETEGEVYDFWFLEDNNNALISTNKYTEQDQTMHDVSIVLRVLQNPPNDFKVFGKIKADKAVYDDQMKRWDLVNGVFTPVSSAANSGSDTVPVSQPQQIEYFNSDLTPTEIPLRQQESYKSLLSSAQLANLAKQKTKTKDQAELFSQKHFRITDPIINIIMLLVALPVLVCRDPKSMKPAVFQSFAITGSCFLITFGCKMVSTEQFIFSNIRPELWAWLPIIIFLPIAIIEIDSMKT